MLVMDQRGTLYAVEKVELFDRLSFGIHNSTLMVRVARNWQSMDYSFYLELESNTILIDEKENQILAITRSPQRDRVSDELCEGLVYYITHFRIVAAPTTFNPVGLSRAILFERDTEINHCCRVYRIPRMAFALKDISTIPLHLNNKEKLIDIAGVLVVTTNLREPILLRKMQENPWSFNIQGYDDYYHRSQRSYDGAHSPTMRTCTAVWHFPDGANYRKHTT